MRASDVRAQPTPYECYRILGLQPGAAHQAVQEAYRKLAFRHHPDVAGDDPDSRTEFIRVTQAYRIISTLDRMRGRTGHVGGTCRRCGAIEELFIGLDRRKYCATCLLETRRRFLPLPIYRTIRCVSVMGLQATAVALGATFIRDGGMAMALASMGSAAASIGLLGYFVAAADQIEG